MKAIAAVAASARKASSISTTAPAIDTVERLRPPDETAAKAPDRSAKATEPELAPVPPLEDSLEPSVYRFILRHSLRQQLLLLVLTLASFPFLYYSLDLPKTIVNHAIGGKHFPQDVLGFQLTQIPYLVTLCGFFLALIFINGGFKYYINTLKGQLGERMLRRFRYSLYLRLLRFSPSYFEKTSSAQIIPMITVESEQLGGFIGDAFVLPLFQGGQLLTIIFFMFMQDPVLGTAAVSLYPLQGYIIPKLQRVTNQLGKRRVRTVRVVADRVQESAAGIAEIQANDNVKLQLSRFTDILGTIYDIRFEIYRRKFFTKFLNNFIGQLTPFFFYLIGGYLVIRGNLSFGALVAVLAAYKDLASPWKELLDYYQNKENSRITYDQIVEQFEPPNMVDTKLLLAEPDVIPHLTGELAVANLSLDGDDNSRVVDAVSFTLAMDEHVAVIGQADSGKEELALLLARLAPPSSGRISAGGLDFAELPVSVVGRRIGYVSATPYLFTGTLRDNLLFGLRHRPVLPATHNEDEARKRAKELAEARRAGNIDYDIDADWEDYESAGVANAEELSVRITEVLRELGFEDDVYTLGLRGHVDPAANPDLAANLLRARQALAERLIRDDITNLVETYNPDRYNTNATMAENLLFGTPIGPVFELDALAANNYVRQVLDNAGLTDDLVEAGREAAATMVEIFADLPPDHEFFEQYSFISADDLPDFKALLAAIDGAAVKSLSEEQRVKLLSLPLKLIAARHRLDVIDEAMQQRLLEARRIFRAELPQDARDQIAFFDAAGYNAAASLQDNILFGKIAYGEADAVTRVPQVLSEVLDELSLHHAVIGVGLDYHVGTAGSRLSLGQRQRTAIARAVLKRPDLMILNGATSALDGAAQAKVMEGLFAELKGRCLVWVLHRASLARNFDRILAMSGGKLQEQGRFTELDHKDSLTSLLMAAE
ncbi:MAG TPA: ABC transporter ATP-binding protein [Stellaceae bacterium]|nr:ABC transporter ATP-binding protein [Stellaceae bacterium]